MTSTVGEIVLVECWWHISSASCMNLASKDFYSHFFPQAFCNLYPMDLPNLVFHKGQHKIGHTHFLTAFQISLLSSSTSHVGSRQQNQLNGDKVGNLINSVFTWNHIEAGIRPQSNISMTAPHKRTIFSLHLLKMSKGEAGVPIMAHW